MRKQRNDLKKEGSLYLTRKEKSTLKILLSNSRTSDVNLAKQLRITSQSAGRIRRKLENQGVIKGYKVELDYNLLGIHAFALVLLDLEDTHEDKVESKNLIEFYKVLPNSATHIALYAFSNMGELQDYFAKLHAEHSKYISIREKHIFSIENFAKLINQNRKLFLA